MKRYKNLLFVCLIFVLISACVSWVIGSEKPIEISEVCPCNETVAYDRFGGYSDYVEIHNNVDYAISLKDYYLSDSKDNLRKYRFPDTTIEPDGRLIIWCRNIDESFEAYVKDSDYITGFSLKEGETIYLSNPDNIVVDKVKLPKNIGKDQSYTRIVGDEWEITRSSFGVEYKEDVEGSCINEVPEFSAESGFYDDDFILEISCRGDSDCRIYYTLDSSDPDSENGMLYEGGIEISNVSDEANRYASISDITIGNEYVPTEPVDKAVVVRAVCVDNNGNQGEAKTATYFVGYGDDSSYSNMMVASLVTDPDNLFGYENGIYVTGKVWDNVKDDSLEYGYNGNKPFTNYFMSGEGWRREAFVQIFDENRKICGEQNVKIGIQGNYSTIHSQKSISLHSLDKEGILNGTNHAGVLDGLVSNGATSLTFRAGGNKDVFSTKVRDVFAQKCVAGRDLGLQNAVPVQVFIDGEYWGLYHLQERIDAGYIVSHYGVDADNIIILKSDSVKAGEDDDLKLYEDVIEYAQQHDLSNSKEYNHMCDMIDIQSFIEYNCMNIYIANVDSVTANYAYWRTKEISAKPYCDGRWRWLVYDTDDSSGVVEDDMSEPDTDSFISGHWLDNPLDEPLLRNLMENQSFREQFARTFIDMAENDFSWEKVEPVLDEIESKYGDAIVTSMRRNRNPEYTIDDYRVAMDVLRRFYRERGDYIVNYMFNDLGLNSADFGR